MTSALLELHGHLIDSLILAKVIDRIQMSGYDYVLADLRVGARKQDISIAQITVWAPTGEELDSLVEELRVHGVQRVANQEAEFTSVTEPGRAPSGAYTRHLPTTEVYIQGRWTSVQGTNVVWVIVLGSSGPELRPVGQLHVGDQVLKGQSGLRIGADQRL